MFSGLCEDERTFFFQILSAPNSPGSPRGLKDGKECVVERGRGNEEKWKVVVSGSAEKGGGVREERDEARRVFFVFIAFGLCLMHGFAWLRTRVLVDHLRLRA